MIPAAVALGALAVALAWPVPIALGRARWPARSPAIALILWQAVALAGGLSMIGSLLAFGLAPYGGNPADGGLGFIAFVGGEPVASVDALSLLALGGAALLTLHLVLNLTVTLVRSERQRRRHAQLVALLSEPLPDRPGARLINDPAPIAYCLPGAVHSVTVFSAGLVALLDEAELRAVIEHERAHAGQRHDIVLILFRAWHASLPWFPIAYRAQREVGLLIEMLADDRARKYVDDAVLARAIALVGAGQGTAIDSPVAVGWVDGDAMAATRARVLRLADHATPLPAIARAAVAAAAMALLAIPLVLLLVPAVTALVASAR